MEEWELSKEVMGWAREGMAQSMPVATWRRQAYQLKLTKPHVLAARVALET